MTATACPIAPPLFAPVDGDELDRLSALYGSGLLDEGPQSPLEALVELAATLLDCPSAMLNLIDERCQRTVAAFGGERGSMARSVALCDTAIRSPGGLVIGDLESDPRFPGHPLARAGVRFYAGMPIHAPGSGDAPRPIGALCVTDAVPRAIDGSGRAALGRLARLADVLIAARRDTRTALGIAREHRRLAHDLGRQHRLFAQAERVAGIGWWRLDLADERIEWSDGVYGIYGLAPGDPPSFRTALSAYPIRARARVSALLASAIENGTPIDFEEDLVDASGSERRVRCLGEAERIDGHVTALVGVFQDVTDRYLMEQALRRDAATDALTGLANRAGFDRALATAARRGDAMVALIDLDGFKAVNDTLGHAAGDEVLREVARRLCALSFGECVAARIGGDEFAVLLLRPPRRAFAPGMVADRIAAALIVPARAGGVAVMCGASVGCVALIAGEPPRAALARADAALYASKRARIGERRLADRRGHPPGRRSPRPTG